MKIFWLKQSTNDVPSATDWLHPAEKVVVSGFKFPKKRNDWLLGRWTAKNTVKLFLKESHPELSFQEIEIRAAEDGAPEVFFEGKPMPVFISLSHSHGSGFCTACSHGTQLGCDLEKIEPRTVAFVKDYFTEKELKFITNAQEENHPLLANLIWSAKESALKALRQGLRIDPRLVEVDFSATYQKGQWNNLTVLARDRKKVFHGQWQFSSDYVFTILCDRKEFELAEANQF
jgi:4'-phosphopantetheinyl transferase